MNPMIEKVARAIASSAAAAFGDRAIHYVENNWGAYTNQARAAISALKDPSPMMKAAGTDALRADYDLPPAKSVNAAIAAYEVMINAALKED